MKLARIAIFLTGVMGIAVGGLVAISALKSNQEQELIRTHESLKSEGTLLVDQFFSVIEAVKKINPKTTDEVLPYVSNYGVVKLKSGVPEEFESFSINDLALQERVLNSLKSQLSINDLRLVKLGLGTYDINETGGKHGIFVALPVLKSVTPGAIDPESIEKVSLVLIDPAKAFAGLEKLSPGNQSAFLIDKNGRVLAHTITSFVGADLKRLSGLKESIGDLFLGAQTGFIQRYSQADGTRQVVALIRAGAFPFAVGVEQKAPSPILSTEWILEQMDSGSARQSAGVAFILIAIALGLFSIMSAWASRGVRLELERSLEAQDSEEPSMGFESLESPEGTFGIDQAAEGWARARNESLRSREEIGEHARALMQSTSSAIHGSSDPVADFESKIQNAMTLETVEKELVEAAGSLTNGNVIYFRYQRRMQNLSLQIASQAANLGSYASLQAYVRKDIELQVEQLSDSGKVASLTHYAPIKRMIQTHFQGKSFEAWAVTSTPEVSLQAKMVGVLVLIDPQGGASFRPKLARILKEAGNYLFAQGNKIKSRGSQELSDSSLMT